MESPEHGLPTNKIALITSDFGAMRIHDHQMARITSDRVPFLGGHVQAAPHGSMRREERSSSGVMSQRDNRFE